MNFCNKFQEILPCGHPCEICRRIEGLDSATIQDHSYSKNKSSEESVSDEICRIPVPLITDVSCKSSTPIKVVTTCIKKSTEVLCSPVKSEFDPGDLDQSFVDNLKDSDYIPAVESETDSEYDVESYKYTQEQIYI